MMTRFAALIWLLLIVKPAVAAPPWTLLVWSDEFDGPASITPDQYTSARLKTQSKFAVTCGRI